MTSLISILLKQSKMFLYLLRFINIHTASEIRCPHTIARPLETLYTKKIWKRIRKQNVHYQKQIKFHRSDQ